MKVVSEAQLEILPDPEALARRVADWLLEISTARDDVQPRRCRVEERPAGFGGTAL